MKTLLCTSANSDNAEINSFYNHFSYIDLLCDGGMMAYIFSALFFFHKVGAVASTTK